MTGLRFTCLSGPMACQVSVCPLCPFHAMFFEPSAAKINCNNPWKYVKKTVKPIGLDSSGLNYRSKGLLDCELPRAGAFQQHGDRFKMGFVPREHGNIGKS